MFEINRDADGTVHLHGRFDAAQITAAKEVLSLVDDCSTTAIVERIQADAKP